MKNIHVLPTDKASRLIIYSILLNEFRFLNEPTEDWKHKRHIYITSDEKIKNRDWYIADNKVYRASVDHMPELYTYSCKKIILTTNDQLIKEGVQAIDDEFLEWFVKNPSCEEVEVEKTYVTNSGLGYREYAVLDSNFKVIEINANIPQTLYYLGKITALYPYEYDINYKIIIPKEEAKQDLEKEMFELEQELNIPSNLRWHNSKPKPKQETLEEITEQIQNECHSFVESVPNVNYQDATNTFLFMKLAELTLKLKKYE